MAPREEIARFLTQLKINSISVNPGSLLRTITTVREAELGDSLKPEIPRPAVKISA